MIHNKLKTHKKKENLAKKQFIKVLQK